MRPLVFGQLIPLPFFRAEEDPDLTVNRKANIKGISDFATLLSPRQLVRLHYLPRPGGGRGKPAFCERILANRCQQ